jgi:protein-L-isoaspartate O-methyltransferase
MDPRKENLDAPDPAPAFVEIPGEFLRSIATDNERIPQLYFCGNTLSSKIFWMRLRWIHDLLLRHAPVRRSVLDFGGGGGVFLPSLARLFERVVSIDLETREAERVVERYGLTNVKLVRADVATAELAEAPFDAIVAADVLEHFRDLPVPVAALRRWLGEGGRLFTSLPTESGLYDRLRRWYGVTRPADHYHTGWEVEAFLQKSGFRRLARRCVPLVVRIAPLYLVSAWSRDLGGTEP